MKNYIPLSYGSQTKKLLPLTVGGEGGYMDEAALRNFVSQMIGSLIRNEPQIEIDDSLRDAPIESVDLGIVGEGFVLPNGNYLPDLEKLLDLFRSGVYGAGGGYPWGKAAEFMYDFFNMFKGPYSSPFSKFKAVSDAAESFNEWSAAHKEWEKKKEEEEGDDPDDDDGDTILPEPLPFFVAFVIAIEHFVGAGNY
ncbi:MAG: hypothetical protein P9L99_21780 [Candidatus Lernaella stagnicola]|nr:hypothetical protein [Candidatus Lernaella stagnicola]